MARFKKGSAEALAWGRKMKRLRNAKTNPKSKSSKRRAPRRTKSKSRRTSFTMAKKKRTSRRKGMFGALNKPLVSGITYAFVQPVVSQFLSRFNIGLQDELVQILGAVVIKGFVKNPIVNNWANAAIIINTASLVSSFAGRFIGGLTAPTTQTATAAPTMLVVG